MTLLVGRKKAIDQILDHIKYKKNERNTKTSSPTKKIANHDKNGISRCENKERFFFVHLAAYIVHSYCSSRTTKMRCIFACIQVKFIYFYFIFVVVVFVVVVGLALFCIREHRHRSSVMRTARLIRRDLQMQNEREKKRLFYITVSWSKLTHILIFMLFWFFFSLFRSFLLSLFGSLQIW